MLITLIGTSGRRRWLLAGVALLFMLLLVWLWQPDRGRLYARRAELLEVQKGQGYVLVGTLGRPDWPAVVTSVETGQGGVSFVTADGQAHAYQGFSGPMKALAFRAGLGGSKRFTLVFHQRLKAVDDGASVDGLRR